MDDFSGNVASGVKKEEEMSSEVREWRGWGGGSRVVWTAFHTYLKDDRLLARAALNSGVAFLTNKTHLILWSA